MAFGQNDLSHGFGETDPPVPAARSVESVSTRLCRYGTWDASVPTGLASFVNALSGTPWMQINQAYTDSRGNRGTSTMRHGGTCYDTGTRGASLSDQDVLVRGHARAPWTSELPAVVQGVTMSLKLWSDAWKALVHSTEQRSVD